MARGKTIKKDSLSIEERLEQALVPDWEQPYKVQENWVWTRLQQVISPSKEKTEQFSADMKYVSLEHISKGNGITGYGNSREIKSLKSVFAKGQILYGRLRPYLNKHSIANFSGVCSTDILVFNATKIVENKLVNYFFDLDVFIDYAISNSKGINLPRISEESILQFSFPLAPLAEQQRIVDRIESLFAKLDEAKEKAQAALDSFETRKAAILHKAFTGELTQRWREENGVELERWNKKRIKDICRIVRGGSPRPAGDPQFYDGSIPFMKVADITRNDTMFVNHTQYSIKEAGLKKTRLVPANTLLLTNSGATLGVPAICTFETTFNDGIAAFLDVRADLHFLYYFWTSKTKDLRAIKKGAAQPNLNTEIIGDIEISVPSLPEQTEIVRILDSLFAKEQKVNELADVIEKIDLMKKAILARAFRGELGTNDPKEESAIELLKEVIAEKHPETKTRAKATLIPKDVDAQLKTNLEREVYRAILKNETVNMDILFGITKNFNELMVAVNSLEKKGLIKKFDGRYRVQ